MGLKIVLIGGAGGTPPVIEAFKRYLFPEWRGYGLIPGKFQPEITCIVPNTDSGGSSGKRGEGYLSDLTRNCIALGRDSRVNQTLMYRFRDSDRILGKAEDR